MKDWRETLIAPDASIRDAFVTIDRTGLQVALVVDDEDRLEGILTDGDIRRGLLAGRELDSPVRELVNRSPVTAPAGQASATYQAQLRAQGLHHLPLVDDDGRLVGLEVAPYLSEEARRPNAAVVMVGGLGTRLRPALEGRPKPLVEVGAKPVLEQIIEGLVASGLERIFLAVHFRREMIEDFCGDGSRWGARIRYLREEEPLGTAGALTLLEEELAEPFIVMNGDLVTGVDYGRLLDYHEDHGADLTVALREFDFEIPYGVVSTDGVHVQAIEEKPTRTFYVSAGIYVADPDIPGGLEPGQPVDMPDVAARLIDEGRSVVGFPIAEYWIDIGQIEDLERARRDAEGAD